MKVEKKEAGGFHFVLVRNGPCHQSHELQCF